MAGSSSSVQIQDGGTSRRKAMVVVSSDPLINALVVTNPDGSSIGSEGSLSKYITYLDKTSTANMTYVGKAVPGTATSAASWSIFRMDKTADLIILQADSGNFSQIWDNRTSLSYA